LRKIKRKRKRMTPGLRALLRRKPTLAGKLLPG
jgi:hypothetical protein